MNKKKPQTENSNANQNVNLNRSVISILLHKIYNAEQIRANPSLVNLNHYKNSR